MASMSGWGALSGLGQGLANVGAGMSRDASELDRQRMIEKREMDLLAARNAGTGALAAARGTRPGGDIGLNDSISFLQDPAKLEVALRSQGLSVEEARAEAARIARGEQPMTESTSSTPLSYTGGDPYNPDADVGSTMVTTKAPKDPTEAAALAERSRVALRRAMGLANLSDSKTIADAEQSEAVTRNATAGTAAGRRGALLLQGKDPDLNDARAEEAVDKGEAAKTRAAKPTGGGGRGGGPSPIVEEGKNQRALIASLERDIRSLRTTREKAFGERAKALDAQIADLEGQLSRARSGISSGGAAPAPAAAASSPRLNQFKVIR